MRCEGKNESVVGDFLFAIKIRTHTATVELTEELPLIATPAPESALLEELEEERE